MAISMSFNGDSGYFLTEDEFEELSEGGDAEELRQTVENLRDVISQAYDSAHDMKYLLGNA